uniref:Helix-turn-helix DNA binding protein n=1 Tax=Mycobacterium phage JustASigh TaxID=3158894 RepID=A0AAU8GM14_9CAUD
MARKRLTQVVLAERAGMATSTLSRRLTGESDFTVGELYRIADVLGVPASALLANVEKASA